MTPFAPSYVEIAINGTPFYRADIPNLDSLQGVSRFVTGCPCCSYY